MPRLLIAGFGYIGQAAAEVFRRKGWEIEGWTRSAESAQTFAGAPLPIRAVDISNSTQVRRLAGNFDWIIHCASSRGGAAEHYRHIYWDGARNLLHCFPEAQLLFTSSTSVYAQTDGSWVDESSPAEPTRETGKILKETEDIVLRAGGTVARVAGIYGPARSFLLRKFLAGEAVIDRERDRFLNQVHRDDIASAMLLLIVSGQSGIFNVVDDQPMLVSECYTWLAQELHRSVPPQGTTAMQRKRGDSNKRVSNKKLRALGWTPRYPTFADGMRDSVLRAEMTGNDQFWKL
jgi:nucleoside-diphosphate-sugar epimerase